MCTCKSSSSWGPRAVAETCKGWHASWQSSHPQATLSADVLELLVGNAVVDKARKDLETREVSSC